MSWWKKQVPHRRQCSLGFGRHNSGQDFRPGLLARHIARYQQEGDGSAVNEPVYIMPLPVAERTTCNEPSFAYRCSGRYSGCSALLSSRQRRSSQPVPAQSRWQAFPVRAFSQAAVWAGSSSIITRKNDCKSQRLPGCSKSVSGPRALVLTKAGRWPGRAVIDDTAMRLHDYSARLHTVLRWLSNHTG